MPEPGQGHLKERQPRVIESTLALTAKGPGLGEGSATCRLDDLGRSLSRCHGQGHGVAQLQGQPLAAA